VLLRSGGHPTLPGREAPSQPGGNRYRPRVASGTGGTAPCTELGHLFKQMGLGLSPSRGDKEKLSSSSKLSFGLARLNVPLLFSNQE